MDPSPQSNDRAVRHTPGRGDGPVSRAALRASLFVVLAAVVATTAFVGESLGHSSPRGGATITVTGSGTVEGTPNTLSFTMGVQTIAASAVAALAKNNVEVSALRAALLAHGVTEKNLQTSGLNIYQNTNNQNQITGFTVQNDLNVTTHRLKEAGAALDAAARAVGNDVQLSGVTFSISNQSSLLASARARAIENAHTAAAQIARGARATVGSPVSIVDQENVPTNGFVYPFAASGFTALARSVPLQTGTQSVSVQVKVVYALNG